MKHKFNKMNDFFGSVPEGKRDYWKMDGVEYTEIYWQHPGGGIQQIPQVQEDLSELLVNIK